MPMFGCRFKVVVVVKRFLIEATINLSTSFIHGSLSSRGSQVPQEEEGGEDSQVG
jgi:hypothetical protein